MRYQPKRRVDTRTREQRAWLIEHGSRIAALVDNEATMTSIVNVIENEIALRNEEAITAALRNSPHDAVVGAAGAKALGELLTVLHGIAKDFRSMGTPSA